MANPNFTDGFEQFLDFKPLASAFTMAGYSGAGSDISLGAGRIPGGSCVISGNQALAREYAITGDVFSLGVAVKFPTRGRFIQVPGVASLEINPETGRLLCGGVEGQVIPAKDRWYYYEIQVEWTQKRLRVFVNGKADIEAPVTGTPPEKMSVLLGGGSKDRTPRYSFDDLYLRDGNRMGPIEITTQIADKNGRPQQWDTSQQDDAGNNVPHNTMVGVTPPEPLDNYVISGIVGNVDMYNTTTKIARSAEIRSIAVIALARVTKRTDQRLQVRHGESSAIANELTTDYRYHYTQLPFVAGATGDSEAGKDMGIVVEDPLV